MKLRASLTQTFLLLFCVIATTLQTDCSTYKVVNSENLSAAAINYLTSITVEACFDTTDTLSFVQETSKLASEVYNCQGCVAVSGGPTGETYWGTLDSAWFLELNVGDYHVLLFVSRDCGVLFTPEYRPVYTLPGSELAEGERACVCSSFTWYTTEGINIYDKYELEDAAKTACSCSSSLRSYVEELASFLYYDEFPSNTLASSTEDAAFAVSYNWYATFRVGCYYTLVFRPDKCVGYQPPKTFPTPTAIIGAPSQSATPLPSVSPSRSHSATPSRKAGVSISPSPSNSPALIGCGNPPCNDHGICQNNQCHCETFYYGPQCQYEYCPGNCSSNGICNSNSGECQCNYPYYGCDCSEQLYNCTCVHGTCDPLSGNCTCDLGWTGTNCSVSVACQNNCYNHGRCTANETCDCFPGWTGEYCNITDTNCSKGCDNGGHCENGVCVCPEPYFGALCRMMHCGTGGTNRTCAGHGKCNHETGSCFCYPGYSGCYCTQYNGTSTPPPPSPLPSHRPPSPSQTPSPSTVITGCGNPPCNNRGFCQNGQCHCETFYYGPQCQYQFCPGNCSTKGYCNPNNGECQCYYPYYGCDCSEQLYNCTCEHGTCDPLSGNCTCELGWTGASCNVSVACESNCNNHGRCNSNQTCDCFPGWTGSDCNTHDLNCTKGCLNGGYCNNITGTCSCPEPYFGPQCKWLHCGTGGTNETCSGHGRCNYYTGSCYCDNGFTGCYCTNWSGSGSPPPAASPVPIPPSYQCPTIDTVCSGNGECNYSNGQCYCNDGWSGCYCNQFNP